MHARIAICLSMVLAATAAHAAQKKPGPESGSVSCLCGCTFEGSDGSTQTAMKYVGGEGNWTGSRAECRDFNESRCGAEKNGVAGVGKLEQCDTFVHRKPGRLQSPARTPSNDKLAPGN